MVNDGDKSAISKTSFQRENYQALNPHSLNQTIPLPGR